MHQLPNRIRQTENPETLPPLRPPFDCARILDFLFLFASRDAHDMDGISNHIGGLFSTRGPLGMPSPVILPEKPISPTFWQPTDQGSEQREPKCNRPYNDENDEHILHAQV